MPLAGALTRNVFGSHFGETPYVTAAERGDPGAGVQFAIPAAWFDRAAAGARLDLQAQVSLPLSFSTHVVQCTRVPCTADDRYRLDDLPVQRLPQIRILSVNLRETADTWTTTPQQVLQRATQIYPGGERMQIASSGAVISIEAITHWTIASTPCAPWKDLEKTTPGLGLRLCQMSAIDVLLNTWDAGSQVPYDALLGIHEYGSEPGWTQGVRPTFATLPSALGHPTFTANRGDLNRPLTAAAHELGHVLGLPHAGQACPTPIGTTTNLPDRAPARPASTGRPTTADACRASSSTGWLRPSAGRSTRSSTPATTPCRSSAPSPRPPRAI